MTAVNTVQNRLRRKALARRQNESIQAPPFSKLLRAWLVKARHNRACAQNHELLMKVQEDWTNGKITQDQIQERVRGIVVQSEKIPDILKPDPRRTYYRETRSSDGKWCQLSTCYGGYIEILISRVQPDMSSDLEKRRQMIAYYLVFGRSSEAKLFHLGLISRLKTEKGAENSTPISGYDSLENAEIVHASEDSTLYKRYEYIVSEQKHVKERVEKAVKICQRHFRLRSEPAGKLSEIEALLESIEGKNTKIDNGKPKKKKKKKKRKKKGESEIVYEVKNGANTSNEAPELTSSELLAAADASAHTSTLVKTVTSDKPFETEIFRLGVTEESNKGDSVETVPSEMKVLKSEKNKEFEPMCQQQNSEITGKYFRVSPFEIKLHMVRPAEYQLSAEMYDLCRGLRNLVKMNEKSKRLIIQKTELVIQTVFPCAKLHLFGSYASNLELPSSDVDCFYFHSGGEAGFMSCEAMNVASMKGHGSTGAGKHASDWGFPRCSMYLPVHQQLELLRRELWYQPWVKRVTLVSSAMPVLRLEVCAFIADMDTEDKSTTHLCGKCFTMDLSCGHTPGHSSFHSTELLQAYSCRFRQLRALTIILKRLLYDKGLNDPFQGGLGSFPLSLLVISFLKYKSKQEAITSGVGHFYREFPGQFVRDKSNMMKSPDTKTADPLYKSGTGGAYRHARSAPNIVASHHVRRTKESLVPRYNELCYTGLWNDHKFGPLLLEFLDFYGNRFDARTTGVSVRGEDVQYYLLPQNVFPPSPLVIDNPFWIGKNLASGAFKFNLVQETFRDCHKILQEALLGYRTTGNPSSILREIFTFKWGHTSKRLLMTAIKEKKTKPVCNE